MIEEPFATGSSIIHKIDPRVKVVCAVLLSTIVALSDNFVSIGSALVLSLILLFSARLNTGEVLSKLKIVWGFITVLWLFLPLTIPGETVYNIGCLEFSKQGLVLSALITLKSNIILLFFFTLVSTMNFITFGYVLSCFKIPSKLIYMLMLTYRYIFVIDKEYQKLLRAVKTRGFSPKTDTHTYKTYAYLMGMLFVKASLRANQVSNAMLCRGFKGKFYCLFEFNVSKKDYIFFGFVLVYLIFFIYLEYCWEFIFWI